MSMARTPPAQKPRGFKSSTRLVSRLVSVAASFRSRSEETGAIVVTILVYRASPAATLAGYPSRCLSDTLFRRVKTRSASSLQETAEGFIRRISKLQNAAAPAAVNSLPVVALSGESLGFVRGKFRLSRHTQDARNGS